MSDLAGLYAITDSNLCPPESISQQVETAIKHGAGIIQYREKKLAFDQKLSQASELHALCEQQGALFIVNDDLDLAVELHTNVHLGQEDSSIEEARKRLPSNAIIGATCHNSLELARQAHAQGASYLAFGAMFTSPTKPNAIPAELSILAQAKDRYQLPVVAIGGITLDNASEVIAHGADMIAVVSAVFGQSDIANSCQQFQHLFNPGAN